MTTPINQISDSGETENPQRDPTDLPGNPVGQKRAVGPIPAAAGWSIVVLGFIAWLVGLTASLANLLNFHDYDQPGVEITILIAIFVMIACLMAGIHRLARPRLSFLFTGLFVTLLIDLNTDMGEGWFLLICGAVAAAAYFQEKVVLKLTISAFGAVLLFQSISLITGFGKTATAPNEAVIPQGSVEPKAPLRPIVHLVLDSYLGLEGMGINQTNFGSLQAEQNAFYLDRGFQVFPEAYSRHVKTINSMPYFFSYGRSPLAKTVRSVQRTTAPQLDYFMDLDRLGYRTSAWTPSFVDLCVNQPMTECRNYNRSNLRTLMNSDLSASDRALLIGVTLVQLSRPIAKVAEYTQRQINHFLNTAVRYPYNRQKLYSLTSLEQLATFTEELGTLEYGDARIIHLLLPHDPFSVDANCNILPESDWLDEHGPAPLAARDEGYAEQVRCTTSRLDLMIDALEKTPAGRNAIIVLHGDHGSRTINTLPHIGGPDLSLRDLALSYSTLFAIRIPGEQATSVPGRFALDTLLGEFARSDFTTGPRPDEGEAEVFVMDTLWIPRNREKLPAFSD